jgi:hypothetical protein
MTGRTHSEKCAAGQKGLGAIIDSKIQGKWLAGVTSLPMGGVKGTFIIHIAGNPELVLDIEGGSVDDGGRAIVWSPNGGENQKFKVKKNAIFSVKSGKALDCQGGLKQGGQIIQLTPNGEAPQQWVYDPETKTIKSTTQNLVLDVKGGNLKPGGEVIAWPPNNGPNQKWELTPTAKAGKEDKVKGRFIVQVASNPGLVLDVSGGSVENGGKLIIGSPDGGDNQKFKFKKKGIFSVKSKKALDCSGGLKQGGQIVQWDPHGKENQQWVYDRATQTIKSTTQNLVLDVKGANLTPGGEVIAWPPNNGQNQKWVLVPL